MIPCILESPYAAPKALRDACAEASRALDLARVQPPELRSMESVHSARRALSLAQTAVQAAEAKHLRYLKALALHAFGLGYAPFASHALYTQWLDDHDPAQRKLGIDAGFVIADALDGIHMVGISELAVLVGVDLGISSGMECGIKLHKQAGREIIEVRLGPDWGRKLPQCTGIVRARELGGRRAGEL
jgi:hypothetical protein